MLRSAVRTPIEKPLVLEVCSVDLRTERVLRDETETPLTTLEAELLRFMSERPGESISTDDLLMEVWGYRSGVQSRAVANTMSRLRTKIEREPKTPRHLITVFGEGYRFEPLMQEEASTKAEPPPLAAPVVSAAPRPRTNIPHRRTRFVGREEESETLGAAVTRGGVLTILGSGGVGKTRLAQEIGLKCADQLKGGAWFVDLCAARLEDDIHLAVANALSVHLPESGKTLESRTYLARLLAQRGPCLLILDNGEQIATVLGEVVDVWSSQAPEAALLVTSRKRLAVEGEQVLELSGLDHAHAQDLLHDRLEALGIHAGDQPQVSLEAISRMLEGIPLALELACARARTLGLPQIVERLSDPLRILKDGKQGDRHGSMWATVEWSWDLLEPVEQLTLAQLSFFQGGFDLEMVEAVVELERTEKAEIMEEEVLQALLDSSTVERIRNTQPPRFRVLLPIREFAKDKLVGRTRAQTWARYAEFFLGRARVALARHGTTHPANLRVLEHILDDLLQVAENARKAETRAEATWLLRPILLEAGQGQRLMQMLAGIDLEDLEGDLYGAITLSKARSLLSQTRFEEAFTLLNQAQKTAGIHTSWLLETMAWAHVMAGDLAAASQAAADALSMLEPPVGPIASRILGHQAVIAQRHGELDQAHALLLTSLEALGGIDHPEATRCHFRLGNIEAALGRFEASELSYRRSIEIGERTGQQVLSHISRCGLAKVCIETHGFETACKQRIPLLEEGRTLGHILSGCQLTAVLALRGVGEGQLSAARSLISECREMFSKGPPPRVEVFLRVVEAMALHWEGRLEEAVVGYRAGLDELRLHDENMRREFIPFEIVALAQAGKSEEANTSLQEMLRVDDSPSVHTQIVRAWLQGDPLPEATPSTGDERTLRSLIAMFPTPSVV